MDFLQNLMQRFIKPAIIINATCLALIAIYIAIMLPTFNIGFYERQFIRNDTHSRINIEPEDLTVVTRHLLDYMRGRHNALQIRAYIAGEEVDFFTERAVLHMVDVQNLFTGGRIIFNISLGLFFITLGLIVHKKQYARLGKTIRNTSLITAAFFALIAIIALVSFDFAFEWFHHIFFFNDLWMKHWDDTLLNMVPTPFFISISIRIGLILTGFLTIMLIGGELLRWRFTQNTGGD